MMVAGRPRLISVIAWGIAVLVTLVPVVTIAVAGTGDLGGPVLERISGVLYVLVAPVYAVTGALIVTRRTRNAVGWLLLALAVGLGVGILAEVLGPAEPPEHLGIGLTALLGLSSVAWVFFIFPIFHLLLVFPTGRVLSPRWRPLVWLEGAMIGFMLLAGLFAEQISALDGSWTVDNPIGFVSESIFGRPFELVWNVLLLALTIGGLVSIVLRHRRARGIERLQMKWFLFAVALFAAVYGGAAAIPGAENTSALDMLLPLAMIGLGVAVAVAVLRYRLYEIDRIISRTVSYALVVGLLVAVVAGVAALAGAQFDEPLVVAATTLGVAALFNPLRRKVQRWVDRRFNRAKYDAEQIAERFGSGLRNEVDSTQIVEGWTSVVATTLQPTTMGVWVR